MPPAPELLLVTVDDVYVWRAPKPGMTLFGARHGRLLVTTRRLVFRVGDASPLAATDDLAATAASDDDGSLALPLERLSARVARRWDGASFLAVTSTDGSASASLAFMTRHGLRRAELLAAQAAIDKAQKERLAHPYRS